MDLKKLLKIAEDLDLPDMVKKGKSLAVIVGGYALEMSANAARAGRVMTAGDRAELEAIHAEAMAVSSRLDAKLADAATR